MVSHNAATWCEGLVLMLVHGALQPPHHQAQEWGGASFALMRRTPRRRSDGEVEVTRKLLCWPLADLRTHRLHDCRPVVGLAEFVATHWLLESELALNTRNLLVKKSYSIKELGASQRVGRGEVGKWTESPSEDGV